MGKGVLLLLLALFAPIACAASSAPQLPRLYSSAPTAPQHLLHIDSIDVDESSLVSRTVTGLSFPLHLLAANHSLGTARVIGGIDTSADQGDAVGGLAWQAGKASGLNGGFGVLRTGSPTTDDGGLLSRAHLRLPMPFLRHEPSMGLSLGSWSNNDGDVGGQAARLTFAADMLGGRYSVSYAQVQPGFQPQGALVTADQSGLDLVADYVVGGYEVKQQLRFQPDQTAGLHGWRSDTYWSGSAGGPLPWLTAFHLHAGLQFEQDVQSKLNNIGWLLEAQAAGLSWRAWQFNTALALARTAACMPERHASWSVTGARPIRLWGFAGSVATDVGVTTSNVAMSRWAVNSGVSLDMHHGNRNVSLGVRWMNNDLDTGSQQPSWRVMLSYSVSAAETLPRLVSAIGHWLPGFSQP